MHYPRVTDKKGDKPGVLALLQYPRAAFHPADLREWVTQVHPAFLEMPWLSNTRPYTKRELWAESSRGSVPEMVQDRVALLVCAKQLWDRLADGDIPQLWDHLTDGDVL